MENATVIVFSTSLDTRNDLRNQLRENGFSAVCFENESVCIDNFESIHPKLIIAETDSEEVVWRFLFALQTIGTDVSLIIVSDRVEVDSFLDQGIKSPVNTIAMEEFKVQNLDQIITEAKNEKEEKKVILRNNLPRFVGHNEAIKQIRSRLPIIADTRDPVMIVGEPGTGKELLARLIMGMTEGEKNIVKIDCAGLEHDGVTGSQLKQVLEFGKRREPTTVFLDHLDQLSKASQAEMLLLIEASEKPINGSDGEQKNKIRFIAASDQKIEELVQKLGFRKDLFYRLNVIPINIPALRERKSDISLLMDYFVIKACIENQKCIRIPSQKAREICKMHVWPGNVDELQNQMRRIADAGSEAHLLANTDMSKVVQENKNYLLKSLAVEEMPKSSEIKDYLPILNTMSLKGICNEFVARTERRLMKRALDSTSWNRKKAAELLNISYKSMLNKMKAYDII